MGGQAIVGTHAVEEALRDPARVNRLYLAKHTRVRRANALIEAARAGGVRFDFVPQAKLNEIAGTREHQGVVAIISPIAYTPLETCLEACPAPGFLVALDQIQHPKNLGMILRTAAASGASGALLSARGGALPDDAVVRASAGTLFHIPLVNCGNLARALLAAKEAGFWVYGMDAKGEEDLFKVAWPDRAVVVLGNEAEGIRAGVRKACDALVRIPLSGDIDSLNVAVAAGLALFQVARHARGAGG